MLKEKIHIQVAYLHFKYKFMVFNGCWNPCGTAFRIKIIKLIKNPKRGLIKKSYRFQAQNNYNQRVYEWKCNREKYGHLSTTRSQLKCDQIRSYQIKAKARGKPSTKST